MSKSERTDLSLPVEGMTCGNCASQVERAIGELSGVSQVAVDLPRGQVDISYNPNQVDLLEFQDAVAKAGYALPVSELTLSVEGMHCLSCVSRVEGALTNLPGILEASASLSKATVHVKFVSATVASSHMEEALQITGYSAAVLLAGNPMHPTDIPQKNEIPATASKTRYSWRFKNFIRRS